MITLDTLILNRTLKNRTLKILSKLDTAEQPAQENIQGFEKHLVKKYIYRQMTAAPEGKCKIYGRRSYLADQP